MRTARTLPFFKPDILLGVSGVRYFVQQKAAVPSSNRSEGVRPVGGDSVDPPTIPGSENQAVPLVTQSVAS